MNTGLTEFLSKLGNEENTKDAIGILKKFSQIAISKSFGGTTIAKRMP